MTDTEALPVLVTGHHIDTDGYCRGCGRRWDEIRETADRSRIDQPCFAPSEREAERLREFARFVLDWSRDCQPEKEPAFWGFAKIEEMACAALQPDTQEATR